MRIQVERDRLLLLAGLLLTIGTYLAIDQPVDGQLTLNLAEAPRPTAKLTQVALTKSGGY